ncbi:alpha-hydroxy-acid oxidizing protein [Paraburkholderia sediminicola]|uniref:alpha-hydroxy-acid oxidizing protein n=1 Tax=Paraburkholderia TaxID=1822464 RepID=UPI0038B7F046
MQNRVLDAVPPGWALSDRFSGRFGKQTVDVILNAADARTACGFGEDGIIVFNHGGGQFDGAVSMATVLLSIVASCPDFPVMIDGGIRRGSDVLKALALGARAVFVERPFAYATSIVGETGVAHGIRPADGGDFQNHGDARSQSRERARSSRAPDGRVNRPRERKSRNELLRSSAHHVLGQLDPHAKGCQLIHLSAPHTWFAGGSIGQRRSRGVGIAGSLGRMLRV